MFSDLGDYSQKEARALDEENKKLKAQLEAVKRLARAYGKLYYPGLHIVELDRMNERKRAEAYDACLAVGIDPKEL